MIEDIEETPVPEGEPPSEENTPLEAGSDAENPESIEEETPAEGS